MRKIRIFSALFGLLGCAVAALGIWLALSNIHSGPVMLRLPEEVQRRVNTVLNALVEGDYETVSAGLSGKPDLGLHRQPADPVGQIIWEALADSFSWEIAGDFYATETGVAVDVVISFLDVDSVTRNLQQRAQNLLQQRVAQATDTDEIYNEHNEYRDDVILEVLQEAARDALKEDAQWTTRNVTLNLIRENGSWQIVPDEALLAALSGGILD